MADRESVLSPVKFDPDLPLLQAIARGDPAALEELYQRCGPRLLAYLTARLADRNMAEEVLQDVMLAAWQSAGGFHGQGRVMAWLLAIARNRAINAYHRQVRPLGIQVALEEATTQPSRGSAAEQEDSLRNGLLALPDKQRETLELVFFHGLSLQETAHVMGVATGTVKSRLHRARKQLAKWIVDEE